MEALILAGYPALPQSRESAVTRQSSRISHSLQ